MIWGCYGVMVWWYYDVMLWYCDVMMMAWCDDMMWCCDFVILWCYDDSMMWWCDDMMWCCDIVMLWWWHDVVTWACTLIFLNYENVSVAVVVKLLLLLLFCSGLTASYIIQLWRIDAWGLFHSLCTLVLKLYNTWLSFHCFVWTSAAFKDLACYKNSIIVVSLVILNTVENEKKTHCAQSSDNRRKLTKYSAYMHFIPICVISILSTNKS